MSRVLDRMSERYSIDAEDRTQRGRQHYFHDVGHGSFHTSWKRSSTSITNNGQFKFSLSEETEIGQLLRSLFGGTAKQSGVDHRR